ncbi:TPA: hypothetical protein QDB05_000255 [Burkholderia vietnamiensis]|nr:hypothetical protein [Burkholderia vietnamiensis]
MTTENSRADALTYQEVEALAEKHGFAISGFDYTGSNSLVDLVNDAIRTARRDSQPAAAPIDDLRQRICKALDLPESITDDEIVTAAELHRYEFRRLFTADVVRGMSSAIAPTAKNPGAMTKAEKQLADWLLTDPQTGDSLHFAGPLEPDFLRFSRIKMQSKSGAVWTLSARLEEGYFTAEERLANIKRAAQEAELEARLADGDRVIEELASIVRAPSPADERAAWGNARESLAVAMSGFASRSENRDFNAALTVLDAITEPGLPLSWLRTARAASANETGAEAVAIPAGYALVPSVATDAMCIAGNNAMLRHWAAGIYEAMLGAAPQPAQASYDGNHVENHCPECSQYESECECAQADARVGLTDGTRLKQRVTIGSTVFEKGVEVKYVLEALDR